MMSDLFYLSVYVLLSLIFNGADTWNRLQYDLQLTYSLQSLMEPTQSVCYMEVDDIWMGHESLTHLYGSINNGRPI